MSESRAHERSRTFTWTDPVPTAAAGAAMSGADYLAAMGRGELPYPPLMATLGMGITEVAEGRAVFYADPAEYHYNPLGIVHGGLGATMLDSAMGCAVHSLLPAGTGYTTLELKVNFVRAITRDTGRVFAEGRIIHLGGRVATAEGTVKDEAGKLYAHATTTCLLLRQDV